MSVFAKGFLYNWTEEIFTVSGINGEDHPIIYRLKDYNNDITEDNFYRHETEPVIHKNDVHLMEKIRSERRRRKSWCLVEWQAYLLSSLVR